MNDPAWQCVHECFGDGQGLSVLLPCRNLAQTIEANLARLITLLEGAEISFELIPIDDASTDDTAAILQRQSDPRIRPLLLTHNVGKGAALMAGAQQAKFAWALLLDGDLDLDPAALPDFCQEQRKTGADAIIGSKRHPLAQVQYPWFRRIPSAVYHLLTRRLLGLPLTDTQAGMKLIRMHALQFAKERMLVKRFAYDLELLTILQEGGFQIAEAPVRVNFGSKWGCFSLAIIWETLRDTLAILYRARILHYYQHLTSHRPPPAESEGPTFSIIVACPGPSKLLDEVIEALAHQTYKAFELIVLPDEPFTAPETPYTLRIEPTGKVRPAEKRNRGAAVATGSILAFLDDDAYPAAQWLANAASRFVDNPTICALGGPAITPPGDSTAAQLSGLVFASLLVSGNFRYRYFIECSLRKIEDYPSCNLFVLAKTFAQVHGFHTDFWPGEDTLLCADLQRIQAPLYYDPRVVVYHHRRPLLGAHLRQVSRYALHRGYFVRRIGENSLRLSYWLPTLLLLGIVIGAPMTLLHPLLAWIYSVTLACYALITFVSAAIDATRLIYLPILWFATIATHLTYGVYFLRGLCAKRMPCQVQAFDHQGQS